MDKYHDFKFFLISLFLALPGRCYAGFPSCGEWGLLFVAVHRLLISTILSSSSLIHSSASDILLLIPSRVFLISVIVLFVSVCLFFNSSQFSSVAQSCLTICDPMNRSSPGLPVHHQLPESTQTHVHWVGDAIQPSHPLSSPSPPAHNPSQHQSLFQCVNSLHEMAKVLEFQL